MTEDHVHLEGQVLDDQARAFLDGTETLPECPACATQLEEHARYLSLARLAARDTQEPAGAPAVESVRVLRRRTYVGRATRHLAGLFGVPAAGARN